MPTNDRHDLGARVREWRESHYLTRAQFLELLGPDVPSESTLRNVEGGYQTPGRLFSRRLSDLIETPYVPDVKAVMDMAEEQGVYITVPDLQTATKMFEAAAIPDVIEAAAALAKATSQTLPEATALVVLHRLRQGNAGKLIADA
jgi:transcriptional regulator with XRE-family HTH domain